MQILVTGASGFVGKHLVNTLRSHEDTQVKAVVRSHEKHSSSGSVNYLQIESIDAHTEWGGLLTDVDVVVHCAARAHILNDGCSDPLAEFRKINVDGTIKLATACAETGVKRFIFISSIGVCGSLSNAAPFNEKSDTQPSIAYAISKLEAEEELRKVSAYFGLDLVIVRPPLVYSASAPGNFSKLLRVIHSGVPLPFSLVKNKRSYIAVENLINFIVTCISNPKASNQTFVVSDDHDLSTPELIRLLAGGMEKRTPLIPFPPLLLKIAAGLLNKKSSYDQLCGTLQIDISKAKKLLGWEPPVSPTVALVNAGREYKNLIEC